MYAIDDATGKQLSLSEYQARASAANRFKGKEDAFSQLRFGFFGEIGSVLSAVKKTSRDFGLAEQANVTEELGDALWYLATIAEECGHTLDQVGASALTVLQRRLDVNHTHSGDTLNFAEFDGLVAFCRSKIESHSRATALCELGANCGHLMAVPAAGNDLAGQSRLEPLGTLLADMVLVSAHFHVKFEKVATDNMSKFESRWPREGTEHVPLFDVNLPELEQLPREFTMRFIQLVGADGVPYVIQQLNGVNIGDRLTDNRTEADGYRFHDVIHLAYVAHLGWSPVIRGLLKLKRKSKPDVDRDQDGARAMIIEEGIATWIFNHAHRRRFFVDTEPGKLEYGLLKQVRDMVKGYEAYDCPLWQWEKAILEGFKVFRELYDAGGGDVHVNMLAHTISFSPVADKPQAPIPRPKNQKLVGAVLPPLSTE